MIIGPMILSISLHIRSGLTGHDIYWFPHLEIDRNLSRSGLE